MPTKISYKESQQRPIGNDLLTRIEAAKFLRLSPGTLANLASRDKGPNYYKPSAKHVLYHIDDLAAYVRSCTGGGVN